MSSSDRRRRRRRQQQPGLFQGTAAWLGWVRPPFAAVSSVSPRPAVLPPPGGPGARLRRAPTRWTRSTATLTSGLCTPTSALHLFSLRSQRPNPTAVPISLLIRLSAQRGHHLRIRQHVNPLSSSFSVKHSQFPTQCFKIAKRAQALIAFL